MKRSCWTACASDSRYSSSGRASADGCRAAASLLLVSCRGAAADCGSAFPALDCSRLFASQWAATGPKCCFGRVWLDHLLGSAGLAAGSTAPAQLSHLRFCTLPPHFFSGGRDRASDSARLDRPTFASRLAVALQQLMRPMIDRFRSRRQAWITEERRAASAGLPSSVLAPRLSLVKGW